MANKKQKKTYLLDGTEIENIKGYRTWLACTLKTGERVIIPAKLLFQIFDTLEFSVEKFGELERFRVTAFRPLDETDP